MIRYGALRYHTLQYNVIQCTTSIILEGIECVMCSRSGNVLFSGFCKIPASYFSRFWGKILSIKCHSFALVNLGRKDKAAFPQEPQLIAKF